MRGLVLSIATTFMPLTPPTPTIGMSHSCQGCVYGGGRVCLQGNKGHDGSNEGAQEEKRKGWSYKSRDHTHF